jgi:hypothetical protein
VFNSLNGAMFLFIYDRFIVQINQLEKPRIS